MKELNALIGLLGPEATLQLVQAFGGVRLYVPSQAAEDSELARVLDAGKVAMLCQYYGGTEIKVPVARRWRIQMYLKYTGKTKREIARLVGCSVELVYHYQRQPGQRAPGQLSLSLDAP